MFHMLTCFNLKPESELKTFQTALDGFVDHMRGIGLVESTSPIGARQSDTAMDTDGERDHQFFFTMTFRDRSQVDEAVIDFAKRNNVFELTRHHSGHGLGFQIHEGPFLDSGDTTLLEPGMMFSCEPGLYELGLGGFRHSDSVLVTASGAEIITNYPRDLESLII